VLFVCYLCVMFFQSALRFCRPDCAFHSFNISLIVFLYCIPLLNLFFVFLSRTFDRVVFLPFLSPFPCSTDA
jgi:hypothetical protein